MKTKKIKYIITSWVLLLALSTVYIVKDFHHHIHTDCCETAADQHSSDSTDDCQICHFFFEPFTYSDPLKVTVEPIENPMRYFCIENNIIYKDILTSPLRGPPTCC